MILWLWSAALAAKVSCDPTGLDQGAQAVLQVRAEVQPGLAAAAIAEACTLPPPVQDALRELRSLPPEHRWAADLRLATLAPKQVEVACPGGVGALAELGALPAAERRAHLWARCSDALSPHLSAAEWSRAAGGVAAPLLFGWWLVALGGEPAAVRTLTRALAGVSDRPEDNKVDRFAPLFP